MIPEHCLTAMTPLMILAVLCRAAQPASGDQR
jgi:hypothetical protein